ncbi:MAG TPA: hypothetical protein VJ907_03150 [Halanaerobiales bacterium]|nr:hypothetical protein [Halanaerobiales bacterium]
MEKNTGAFICDENAFNRILSLEKRRGDKFIFMVISFDNLLEETLLEEIFEELVILLRTKDVVTKSGKQIFLLLNNANLIYGEDIVRRLNNLFDDEYPEIKPIFTLKNF